MSKFIMLGLLGLIVFLTVKESDAVLSADKEEENIVDKEEDKKEDENINIEIWKNAAKNFCDAFDRATGLQEKPKLDDCIANQKKDVHDFLNELILNHYNPKIKEENFYFDENKDKNVALQTAIRAYYGIFDTLKVSYTQYPEYASMMDLELALTGYDSPLNAVAQPAGQNQVQPNVVNQAGT